MLTSEGYVITVPETKFPPQKPTTQRSYQTPVPQTPRPYQPPAQQQTPRPYQPPAKQPTPRPYQPPAPQTQRPPFKGEEYIPPKDNHIGEPSNEAPTNYLPPPERGEEEKSEPIQGPSNDSPNIIRPGRPGDAPAPLPPTQCPAATNCTEIQFCTANGVISKTPVVLSPDQETFRVPLSDCRSIEKGYTGKCCRDPDYVDPWPVGILGQYNASILGFDDGSYKPPGSNGGAARSNGGAPRRNGNPNAPGGRDNVAGASGPVAIRGQEQLSLPIAVTAQTQNTYTRTPFPQQQPNQLIPQRVKDTPYTVEPIASGSGICAVRDNVNNFL